MKPARPEAVDESSESEITIRPDGRIYAFGITRQLVDLLATIPPGDEQTRRLLERLAGRGRPEGPLGKGMAR